MTKKRAKPTDAQLCLIDMPRPVVKPKRWDGTWESLEIFGEVAGREVKL